MTLRVHVALRVFAGLALAAAMPADARAQRITGPFAGLFGADKGEHTQALDVRAGLGTTYDTGDGPDGLIGPNPAPRLSQSIITALSYERHGDRGEFLVGGGTTLRQYADTQSRFAASHQVGSTLNTHLTSKVTLAASGGFNSAPFFLVTPFAGSDGIAAALATDEYGVVPEKNRTLDGTVTVTDQYAKASNFGASLGWRTTRFPAETQGDVDMWSAKGTFVHRFTRSLSFESAFGREEARYKLTSLPPMVNDIVDVGLDYGSEVPLARRTSFSFAVRPSMLRRVGSTNFRLNGSAQAIRGFGRTWSSSLAYTRSTEFVAGITAPLFWDSLTASINGLIATRVEWWAKMSAAHGEEGSGLRGAITEYTGSSRLTIAITRRIAAYGQFTYYHHEIPPGLAAFELRSLIARQRVSAGISLWLPLATEMRAPRDTR
jgi:hypothetical protein